MIILFIGKVNMGIHISICVLHPIIGTDIGQHHKQKHVNECTLLIGMFSDVVHVSHLKQKNFTDTN